MDFTARHIGFVLAAYGIALALIAAMALATVMRYRAVKRRLEELERLGAPRRRKAAPAPSADSTSSGDPTEKQPA